MHAPSVNALAVATRLSVITFVLPVYAAALAARWAKQRWQESRRVAPCPRTRTEQWSHGMR